MVKPVAKVSVVPRLPEPLKRFTELAYNLRWSWDDDSRALFRRLDRELWVQTTHNPVTFLGMIDQRRLEAAVEDPSFMAHYRRVIDALDQYMNPEKTWYSEKYKGEKQPLIAYFSMEFGLTECLQNYSGGLGVLSGDHLKSASDLGVPLVGVGLLYQEGYFRQYLNADGYQQELYPINDYSLQPVTLMRDKDGEALLVSVELPGRPLYAQIWKVQVGRVPLYLLDTNIDKNPLEEDRNLTDRLYGGDRRTRIRQEILMGIGGIRALEALGLRPDICHMNEGHSAFLALERIRNFMREHKVGFYEAMTITGASQVFTTHTPVPAGLERFGFDLMDEHFTNYARELGLTREQFLDLGRENMGTYELFSMPVMAVKMSAASNGVAKLHGDVSRRLWQWMSPSFPVKDVPISSVTNGIHTQTWVSRDIAGLLDRYLDPAWRSEDWRPEIWEEIDQVPDSELWRTHEFRRERLVLFARKRLVSQLTRRGASQAEIGHANEVLNPQALTIGFARRFATYKRATMLFRDQERLLRILTNPERPMQFVFAGKAHPHDEAGKEFIRQIAHLARQPQFRDHLVFIEDYDMLVARYMVQGVDVWLNNPRRPQEASGTSGMKVIYNGGLNCSILDGWWAEGHSPEVGWAIGNGEEYPDEESERQDYVESEALYNILEHDIAPLYYERMADNVPRGWMKKMKQSFKTLAPYFNTSRMVQEYTTDLYMPNYRRHISLVQPDLKAGSEFAQWRTRVLSAWKDVRVADVTVNEREVSVGSELIVTAQIELGALTAADVFVEAYYGTLTSRGDISDDATAVQMTPVGASGNVQTFTVTIIAETSGDRGISVRVMPNNKSLQSPFALGVMSWA
ncbi:MAG: alpha-glucan family phosphorylase [Pleurocapsa minor GSE-CHR-MK-17-07R]|jgi:starch phosphorylase|nr:alpha-glucan family phosphorylase [Pleurocapsa minor GSE-CHR-MK 17-07R]